MNEIVTHIEKLRSELEKHKGKDLKETPTRHIFIGNYPIASSSLWRVSIHSNLEIESWLTNNKSDVRDFPI